MSSSCRISALPSRSLAARRSALILACVSMNRARRSALSESGTAPGSAFAVAPFLLAASIGLIRLRWPMEATTQLSTSLRTSMVERHHRFELGIKVRQLAQLTPMQMVGFLRGVRTESFSFGNVSLMPPPCRCKVAAA